jgi:hypothetical protein
MRSRLGELDTAADCLNRARLLGWVDLPWLRTDPELAPLHGHPAFVLFVEQLAAAPDVEIAMPRFVTTQSPSGTA